MYKLSYERFLEKIIEGMSVDELIELCKKDFTIRKNTDENLSEYVLGKIDILTLLELTSIGVYSTNHDYFIFKEKDNFIWSFNEIETKVSIVNDIGVKCLINKIANIDYYKNKYQEYLKR